MSVLRVWARDLAMGVRFAVTGGREGLLRTALTAVGVGIGVTLLFFMAAMPQALDARVARETARGDGGHKADRPGVRSLLVREADTVYHGRSIRGRLLRPEGPRAPRPPGVATLPGPGEMVVSPALRDLLASDDGALLRERLPHRTVGTVDDKGVGGPGELVYYAGSDRLAARDHAPWEARRITAFGEGYGTLGPDHTVTLLGSMGCAVLLLPVGVLIATAVRFGGERRDRRLAALRLVGADNRMTRRVAAGEALCAALIGLAAGAAVFLWARRFGPGMSFRGSGFFPADLTPGPAALVFLVLGVPLSAVAVSLFALRDVAIEPLGVVRGTARRRRRLWWRLTVPAVGVALLVPLAAEVPVPPFVEAFRSLLASVGGSLLLLGVTTLLPWLVEAVVGRLRGGGPPSWQLATRRLQLDSGPASRAVTGIVLAVAGAISVQMLLAAVGSRPPSGWGKEPDTVHASLPLGAGGEGREVIERLRRTEGVRSVAGVTHALVGRADHGGFVKLDVGDCRSLRRMARLDSCEDGDVFVVADGTPDGSTKVRPGTELALRRGGSDAVRWTVPATAPVVRRYTTEFRRAGHGVLATPSAVDVRGLPDATADAVIRVDPSFPEALERVRNTAAALGDVEHLYGTAFIPEGEELAEHWILLRALPSGAAVTVGLVGVSLMLATVEQLRERRRMLATLAAFGTRRSTVAWSVVWQTAIPVALGMLLAVAGGLVLGAVLAEVTALPVRDWFAFLPTVGLGIGVIALVTLAALPPLWRMMRPDGLRAE